MTGIEQWLRKFKEGWKKGNKDKVLNLFTDDVEYYETPTQKLRPEELQEEWENVKQQENISLNLEIFATNEDKHVVQWELAYIQNGEEKELNGVYLIKLNSKGKCFEFWQYCQTE